MLDLDPAELAVRLPALLVAVTFHEFAHARVAKAFGDRTAEEAGRVTLNPLAHLDPIGTIGLIIGTFGWGKPVPVSRSNMNHPRADFLVSAAGPLTNFALALLGSLLLRVLPLGPVGETGAPSTWLVHFLYSLIMLNLLLGTFNLLPLFPLDGSHMAENLLPIETAYAFNRFNQSYGMAILFGLLAMGYFTGFAPLDYVIGPPIDFMFRLLVR